MPDIKQVLFEKAKFFNDKAMEYVNVDDETMKSFTGMAVGVEVVIVACNLWDEYMSTYRKDGE